MARHGENIRKRKDGRWEGRYIKGRTPDGKAKLGYVYGKTYGQVRQRLVQYRAQCGGGGAAEDAAGDGCGHGLDAREL